MNIYPILKKLNNDPRSLTDRDIIFLITQQVRKENLDNITRTKAYARFFQAYPEIKWSFLASMVSRNAGWNMCDLEGEWLPKILPKHFRYQLFLTYERANWLIFQDAYPQLLVYHYMTRLNRSLLHIFPKFHVSQFMVGEWESFHCQKNEKRLLYALIVNEQHLIQKPVIENPIFKYRVFNSKVFVLQDFFHFNCVVFPTLQGELYGSSVTHFKNHKERIKLGKRLSTILFSPDLHPMFLAFSNKTEHTGSRWDYEQYQDCKKYRTTPFLRGVFPGVSHHIHSIREVLWEKYFRVGFRWANDEEQHKDVELTNWFEGKQYEMKALVSMEQAWHYRKLQQKKRQTLYKM